MDICIPIERTLTHYDHLRLARLLAQQPAPAGAEALQELQELLDGSELVAGREVPATLVTMNTQVLVLPEDGPPCQLTVCYPEDARPSEGCVSVLSPVGASLLGLRVGETAQWRSAAGVPGAARILSVLFQPEAHGEVGA